MKQNELFNKCCENCDPKTREEVWKQMDKELGRIEPKQNSYLRNDSNADMEKVDEMSKKCAKLITDQIDNNLQPTPLEQAAFEYGGFSPLHEVRRYAFKAGAEWQKKEFSSILDKWEEHAIRGMKKGASAYHQGKIALICDLRDYIKEN